MTNAYGSMQGKTCLVTGATRGIGQSIATEMARLGARVVIIGRDPTRIENTISLIRAETGNDDIDGIRADLSSLAEVRQAAAVFSQRSSGLDVLINNVGATLLRFQTSPDGLEKTWALNYLGHFLITNLLLDTLKAAAAEHGEARIVEITSSMFRFAHPGLSRLEQKQGYNGVLAYAKSKRAINLFTKEMAHRLQGSGVTINAITPGIVRTRIAAGNGFLAGMAMRVVDLFSVPLDIGIRPILHLAASSEMVGISGKCFYQYKPIPEARAFGDNGHAEKLWNMSEAAINHDT